MPVQMIELEEVQMVEVSDESLEVRAVRSEYTIAICDDYISGVVT